MHTVIGTDVSAAAGFLLQGEAIAIPTETVYGLAANALDQEAVLKIFRIKERPAFDPLIVHIASADQLDRYAYNIPPLARVLAHQFWPGPLTLILKKKTNIPDLVTSGLDTVGIRIPDHPLTLELLSKLDFPLAAPSANPFGYVSPTSARHVNDQFSGRIPYILDGGLCKVGIESTIVGFDEQDGCVIYRMGGLALRDIEAIAGCVRVEANASSDPRAPGMLKSHYAPKIPVLCGDIPALLHRHQDLRCAVLCLKKDFEITSNVHTVTELSHGGNMEEAARNLFAALRNMEQSGAQIIIAGWMPEKELGPAINDRLRRAMS